MLAEPGFNAGISPCLTMTCRVTCYVAGKVFTVDCEARNYQEAREVALAQHPNARIMGATALTR
jgi:hypothetical protein